MYDVELIPVPEPLGPSFLPVFSCLVPAGFPSPADDYVDELFDLNKLLFRYPEATYLVRVTGESMAGAEIHTGDLLAVDKHLAADHGDIVVAVIDGDCTVKRLELHEQEWWLMPANPAYKSYHIRAADSVRIWGVVTHVVREVRASKLAALLRSRD
jgi:DNA polymerase V